MILPLAVGLWSNLAVVLFVLTCLSLILIVLLQKGRGGGIGAAFGGGGAGSLLGTKTGDVLTWITICLVAFFLVLAVLMGKFIGRTGAPAVGGQTTTQTQQNTPSETTIPATEGDLVDTPETTPADMVEGATDIVEATTEVIDETTKGVTADIEEAVTDMESAVESTTDTVDETIAQ